MGNDTKLFWNIMHMERVVASISSAGKAEIIDEKFMPYDLYLDEEDENDIDILVNNLYNFHYWCASRVLSLDRKYAKEILNSIGVSQVITDKDRARISLSYHCVSLTDVYWVKKAGDEVTFAKLNLYDNPLNEAIVELSLKGHQMTVTNQELAPDLSTKGCFPKAWIRRENGFRLLKDGGEEAVRKELLASAICQCFGAYDTLDGANCLTVATRGMSQREAAIEGVKHIGLRQIREMDMSRFGDMEKEADMFRRRWDELKKYE